MRRMRKHKYFQIAVFFLIYSIIHVVSTNKQNTVDGKNEEPPSAVKTSSESTPNVKESSTAHSPTQKTLSTPEQKTESTATEHPSKSTSSGPTAAVVPPTGSGKATHPPISKHVKNAVRTGAKMAVVAAAGAAAGAAVDRVLKKTTTAPTIVENGTAGIVKATEGSLTKNQTGNDSECTPAAIKQFPRPLMGQSARVHGGFIIHIIVAMYMFLGLAIVCDEYFVASLDRICEELKMSPDVAGATFMAAGSSAPELATVVIGVFFAKDDIGISGVIGSAVFNIMFVIACCGLCSTAAVYLNWWPLIRDCFFYAVSILVMLVVISDKEISWVESIVMLITYIIYCIVLHFNTPLERWAQTWPVPFKARHPTEESGLVSYKTLEETGKHQNYGMEWSSEQEQPGFDQSIAVFGILIFFILATNNFGMEWSPERQQESFANQLSGPALNQATTDITPGAAPSTANQSNKPNQQDYYKPKEYDPAAYVNPLIKPEGGGYYALASWGIVYPIHWLCIKTMPDCRTDKYRNWYPFTFVISMLWISFYSYFMVWMITIIGYTLGIPDTVMGLTFVAAGVSVPDALSSIAVMKEGYGDMAVSNAVGSNVFDILICLGLPWFLKTAIVKPGSTVRVISKGLTYSTLSLLSTVVFLVVATHLNGWKLDRRYGIILMVWYLIFITFASMYELNVFGPLNPPVCDILDGW